MNIDYALSQALTFCAGIRVLLVMYDVACQYHKNVKSRFNRASSLIPWPVAMIIYWGIGLFHIHGHQQDYFPKFSPTFIVGAGNIDGEIIETLWAFLNRISGSIRAMATSHRKGVLDDHMNEVNWRKTVGMGEQYEHV